MLLWASLRRNLTRCSWNTYIQISIVFIFADTYAYWCNSRAFHCRIYHDAPKPETAKPWRKEKTGSEKLAAPPENTASPLEEDKQISVSMRRCAWWAFLPKVPDKMFNAIRHKYDWIHHPRWLKYSSTVFNNLYHPDLLHEAQMAVIRAAFPLIEPAESLSGWSGPVRWTRSVMFVSL